MSQKKKEQHWASTSRYDTGELLRDLDGGADTYSLEEILAEYGHGGVEDLTLPEEQEAKAATEPAQEPVREQKAAPAPKPVPEEPRRETKASEPEFQESPEEPEEAEEPQEEEQVPDLEVILPEEALPRPPRPISVEEVVGRTVESLMAEPEPLKEKKQRRRFLFSRRPMMRSFTTPPPQSRSRNRSLWSRSRRLRRWPIPTGSCGASWAGPCPGPCW